MGCFESKVERREPTAIRGCTDVCWLCIYIIFWFALLVVAIFSFVYGNPLKIINGFDSFGNTCGVKSNEKFSDYPLSGMNTIDKPYVFFLDMNKMRQTVKICVKECPKNDISTKEAFYKYYQNAGVHYCRYDFNINMTEHQKQLDGLKYFDTLGPCPKLPVYESSPVLNRCIPLKGKNAPPKMVEQVYDTLNKWGAAEQLLNDLYKTWPLMIILCIASLVLSIMLITMLHWLTKIISWLICIFVGIASIAITIVLWFTWYNIHNKSNDKQYSALEQVIKNETAIYILAIVATVIMIFLIIIIILLRKKIGGLAALFEEAGKCMLQLPGLFLPPILAFIALVIFFVFWISVVICLATANYPDEDSVLKASELIAPLTTTVQPKFSINDTDSQFKSFKFIDYVEAGWLRKMLWLYFIGLIWTSEFIFACQQLTIAGAVAFWYFRKPVDSPILHAICKLVKYHLGSVAKGSFIITLFKVPRLILTYLYAKLKKNEQTSCASCGLKCCICCFYCLEKFIRYLNHNAYTVIAIESINFCPAAGIAWNALMSNALQVATINGIGDFILFLGKIAVAALCGLISILILRKDPDVNFYVAPVILITLFSFFIAHVVLSLYEIVVDTLFLCVCEDRTINGPNGRWKESNLALLLGEIPGVEAPMQQIELTPITKEPFRANV